MRTDYRVLLDACVLANHGVCDLLLRLAESPRLYVPLWSAEILREVQRTHEGKLQWPSRLAAFFQEQIHKAFPEAEIRGWEPLMENLMNDRKDRHVLAAAIKGNAHLILTFNLKHFPEDALTPWGLKVCHPQDYLLTLYKIDPVKVMAVLGEIAGRRQLDIDAVLERLEPVLPCFSRRVRTDIHG